MTIINFITSMFYLIYGRRRALLKHAQVVFLPSKVLILGVFHALKRVSNRYVLAHPVFTVAAFNTANPVKWPSARQTRIRFVAY